MWRRDSGDTWGMMATRKEISEAATKFSGRFINKVDAKGRTFFPAKLKPYMSASWGPKPDLMFTVMGFDRCLVLVDREAWFLARAELDDLDWFDEDSAKLRRLSSLAEECTLDSQGRIMIPQFLRKFARITGEVMFVGCEDYVELWNPGPAEDDLEALFKDARGLIHRVRERSAAKGNPPVAELPDSDDSVGA